MLSYAFDVRPLDVEWAVSCNVCLFLRLFSSYISWGINSVRHYFVGLPFSVSNG